MWHVVQITETREEFVVASFRTESAAEEWIYKNREQYPESHFVIESMNSWRGTF